MDLACVFFAALAFYSATLAPTVVWGDSAWFALETLRRWPIRFGTAGDHPLFVLVGRLFAFLPGDPARNLNFESAIFGALAVMMAYRCARQLGTSRLAAATGAAALCVSHAFWLHAVIAEVYTANAFFLLATISLLLDWKRKRRWHDLAAALAVLFVGLINHMVLAALAPAILVFVATERHDPLVRRRVLTVVAVLVCAVVVSALTVPSVAAAFTRLWVGPPSIAEYFGTGIQPGLMVREGGYYALLLSYQFPSISLLLGVVGAWALWRTERSAALLLLLAIAVNAGVFIHHAAWPSEATTKFVFYIADYAVFGVLCAVGTETFLRRLSSAGWASGPVYGGAILAAVALVPPFLYSAIPAVANRYGVDLVHAKTLPYRDNETYFLNPNKHGYRGAREFGEAAFQAVPPSSVIFGDFTPFAVLMYLQNVENFRRDVTLRHAEAGERVAVEWVVEGGSPRRIYLTTWTPDYYDMTHLVGPYDLVPFGPLIEVRPREVR